MSAHVLVVDDEPDIRRLVKEILEDEGYHVDVAENADAARAARRARRPDLVLLDIWMPDTDGISLLKEWSDSAELDSPVLMMSGHGTVETAVEATRLGAYDFIEKPLSTAKLLLSVRRALEADHLARENVRLRHQLEPVSEPIGQSEVMESLRQQIRRLGEHDTAVLITGESGTGKEVLARYLHSRSTRRAGPFIRVAVASLTGQDSATELFGVEDGTTVQFGYLEQASGGTLFLEDIADMDRSIQARLLGALQHGSFLRAGGIEPVQTDTRIITATSHDLAERVQAGEFHEDLYYHLNVVPLRIPPLREHPEDIPALVNFQIDRLVAQENLPYRRFSVAAQNRLRNHSWPGNIRELQNVVQRILMLGTGDTVGPDEIERALGSDQAAVEPGIIPGLDLPFKDAREQFERLYLEHQLKRCDTNISQLASQIGIERTHLYRKLKSLGIDPKQVSRG